MTESLLAATTPLISQVGGHAGVLTTEDGSLLIKPALPLEHSFYQSLQTDPGFAPLRPFTPKFYGTLKLEGRLDENQSDQGVTITAAEEQKDERPIPFSFSLSQNLLHSFHKPNVLDIKLGTVLHDEFAPPDKVERMMRTALATTSYETGIRLTGFQVYDNITSELVITPKSYGKSIKASELPEGIARFFPVAPEPADDRSVSVTSSTGLPGKLIRSILNAIHQDIVEIRNAFADMHIRMVGGSLLIIYEADWAKAKEKLEQLNMRTDEEGEEGSYEEEDEEEQEEDEDDDDDDDDSKRLGPAYVVKLIDFAHTRITPGRGPDEGVLRGFDTVLNLLKKRLDETP